MIGICSAILPSNGTTSTLSFSWSTPFTSEGKHFRKKEYSDCQVRRGKSNVAVGLQLYGPSIAQLIATLISRWDLRLQWLQIQSRRVLDQLKTHSTVGTTHVTPSCSAFNHTAMVNSAASPGACREGQFLWLLNIKFMGWLPE